MKSILYNFLLILDDIRSGKKGVTFFFLLLVAYYVINLLTSPINSGMSGGLEAEHNIYNQITAGLLVLYMSYFVLFIRSKQSYWFLRIVMLFLFYVTFRTYLGFATDYNHHSIFSFSPIINLFYWGFGLIFSTKCFQYTTEKSLRRLIQFLIYVFLFFVTYRLFTQKALLMRLGMSAGINVAAHTYMIIPLVMMVFRGKQRLFLYFLCAFVCVYSAKRQSVLGLAIVSLFSLKIIYDSYIHKRKIIVLLLVLLVVSLGEKYIERIFSDLIYRQERLEEKEDEDSGRIQLWETALYGFQNADNTSRWFGGGPGTSRKYIGVFYYIVRAPHNGFIQILCDFGYIGVALYIAFFLLLLAYVVKIRGLDNKLLYLSICMSWIFANIISHPGSLRFIFLAIGIGYLIYMQKYERNRLNQRSTTNTFKYSESIYKNLRET